MFETLSERLQCVLRHANQIAREYGQEYVGTEHLLLGILREGTGTAVRLLAAHGVTEASAKAVVDRLIKQRLEDTWVMGQLPGTPHFRNTIAEAIETARRANVKTVESEHLLLALLAEKGSVAHSTLTELKVKAKDIQAELTRGAN
jgi:ATP-dependent Clp protease ATP-binding subunit ClpA